MTPVSLSRKTLGIALLSLGIAAFIGLMAYGLARRAPVTGLSGITRVGKPAPEFALPLFDGGEFVPSRHTGSAVVVNFWASWCPPCREEAPLLERAWRSYRNSDVQFVGVQTQDAEEDGRAYLKEFGVTYPSGMDAGGRITVDYGVIGLPVTFLINRDGVVERRWVGAIGEEQLTSWLEELTAGVAPSGAVDGENLEGFFEFE